MDTISIQHIQQSRFQIFGRCRKIAKIDYEHYNLRNSVRPYLQNFILGTFPKIFRKDCSLVKREQTLPLKIYVDL